MSYASQTDLTNVALPSAALATLSATQISAVLQNASDFADSFFRARWGPTAVPLLAWDTSVTKAVASIAALWLLRVRGYEPHSGADALYQSQYNEAVEWLNKVQRQQAHPNVTLAGGAAAPQQPNLVSESVIDLSNGASGSNRGW